jgi:hypothetical protein
MTLLKSPRTLLSIFLFSFASLASSNAYQNLSTNIGGGYAANLYADSFAVGNSYLVSGAAFSTTNFQHTHLKAYYGVSYFEYNTNDNINNFFHLLGTSLYRRDITSRFKWGIDIFAAVKDYVDENSDFNNYRVFGVADISYYIKPGLQFKGCYRGIRPDYSHYETLNNFESHFEAELVGTLPSRTTIRGAAKYAFRIFDNDNEGFDWFDGELGFTQSLGIKTGAGLTLLGRISGEGNRPLSTYYILSGITPYWDPWDGFQIELFVKRILPLSIVSRLDTGYWSRKFEYDLTLRRRFPWLLRKAGRTDRGWIAKLGLSRQLNLGWSVGRSVAISLNGGYLSNGSDDPFYEYDNYFLDSNLEIRIF